VSVMNGEARLGEGGEETARVLFGVATMFMLQDSGWKAAVPPVQGTGVVFGVVPRRDVGMNAFGFPPCWFRQVAPSMCPGALFLQVALEWVAFAVLPCVQQ
jgi:hypothetical protein